MPLAYIFKTCASQVGSTHIISAFSCQKILKHKAWSLTSIIILQIPDIICRLNMISLANISGTLWLYYITIFFYFKYLIITYLSSLFLISNRLKFLLDLNYNFLYKILLQTLCNHYYYHQCLLLLLYLLLEVLQLYLLIQIQHYL